MEHPIDRLPLDHLDIAVEMIGASGGLRTLPVTGESMLPTFGTDDALLVDLGARRPRAGDVVLFRSGDSLVVHRYLRRVSSRRRGDHLRMRGDGRSSFDPPVRDEDIRGIVRAIRRGGTWWSLEGSGARFWGLAVSWHDRFWGVLFAAARRFGGSRGPSPWIFRADRRCLRVADRALFSRFHRKVEPDRPDGSETGVLL
jgi:hypothetical protein